MPCDASCLSVVSFSITTPRVQSFRRTMLCISVAYAIKWCPSGCLSSGSHTIVVFPHQTLYQYSEGQLVTYLHGSICTSNWRFLPPPQIRGTLKIIPASTTPTFKYATLRLHSHSLTNRPSSMRVGDSRRPLRYLFFSIVLDLVTSPLAECIRSRSTLQCCVSTVFSVCLNAVTLP